MTAWKELGIDLEVGFNLSPRQFWQPDLAERIVREIRVSGVDPSRVMVEVTESSAMMDPDRAQRILTDLTDQGFAIAIDDFGTGYSSLSRLRDMPVRVLKIDRSFVSNVDTDPQSASIVSAFLAAGEGARHDDPRGGHRDGRRAGLPQRTAGASWARASTSPSPSLPRRSSRYSLGGIPAAAELAAG